MGSARPGTSVSLATVLLDLEKKTGPKLALNSYGTLQPSKALSSIIGLEDAEIQIGPHYFLTARKLG